MQERLPGTAPEHQFARQAPDGAKQAAALGFFVIKTETCNPAKLLKHVDARLAKTIGWKQGSMEKTRECTVIS